MQVELSPIAQEIIERYRGLVQNDLPSFKPSVTTLVNEAAISYFEDAIDVHCKINKPKKK